MYTIGKSSGDFNSSLDFILNKIRKLKDRSIGNLQITHSYLTIQIKEKNKAKTKIVESRELHVTWLNGFIYIQQEAAN